MRKLFTILLLLSIGTRAQYYGVPYPTAGQNPGALNNDDEYPVGSGLSTTWTSIHPGSAATPAWSPQQSIPFTFQFNGAPVSNFFVSTSGVLTFSATPGTAPAYANQVIPSTLIPDQSVMAWGIEGTGSNDNIVRKLFGNAPNRQLWIMFSSYTVTGSTSYQYWSIVLEETSNNIYVVDQRCSNPSQAGVTIGIQIDQSNALCIGNTNNLSSLAGTNFKPADNAYYMFVPGTQPANDAHLLNISTYEYQALPNAPFTLEGNIHNAGSSNINSMEITYAINGGAAVNNVISGLNIAPGTSSAFACTVPWNPSAAGAYTVEMAVATVNSNADLNTTNNTATKTINVVPALTQLTPLFEVFTSSTCSPCAASNPILDALLDANPNKFTCVKYQMDFPGTGDPYVNADGITRQSYYGVTGIPDIRLDGTQDISAAAFGQPDFDAEYLKPAFMNINATWSITNKTVTVNAAVNALTDISGTNRLFIAVVENPTVGNAATNGETEFHYVEQKMLPNGNGNTLAAIMNGVPQNISATYTFPDTAKVENFNNLLVAVWVQNVNTKLVHQSTFATKVLGRQEFETPAGGIVSVYPNPAGEQLTLAYQLHKDQQVSISLVNMLGEVVWLSGEMNGGHGLNKQDINLSGLSSGVYFADLSIGNNHYRTRFVKQ